ncbi:MAG: YheC/YheD family protein [Bacillota bacterium]
MPGSKRYTLNHKFRPLIGVFVNKKFFLNPKGKLFASKLIQANDQTLCSIYFFSPEDIDWRLKEINGSILECNSDKWLNLRFPFPDIVYDRAVAFKKNQKKNVESIRQRLNTLPSVKLINSCTLEKWQVFQKLAKFKYVNKFLPATILYNQFEDVIDMLARYGSVFLKNPAGSGGRSVLSVEKQENGFSVNYYKKRAHQKQFARSLGDLQLLVEDLLKRMPEKIIVQQGIRLIKYNGRLLDLRVLLVKDKNGKWSAVYNQARVAQKGTVITNLSLGGDVANYSTLYPELKKRYPQLPANHEICLICVIIARYIEKAFGPFGEIGMDIGIDETGRVWFLEGNSKPSKLPEKFIEDNEGISPQFLMTLEYAKLLYS